MTASEWKNQLQQHDNSHDEVAVQFGRNVTHLRRSQKINKQTFALMVGISRPHLDAIEAGEVDARISLIMQLAEALSVPPDKLVFTDMTGGSSPR